MVFEPLHRSLAGRTAPNNAATVIAVRRLRPAKGDGVQPPTACELLGLPEPPSRWSGETITHAATVATTPSWRSSHDLDGLPDASARAKSEVMHLAARGQGVPDRALVRWRSHNPLRQCSESAVTVDLIARGNGERLYRRSAR